MHAHRTLLREAHAYPLPTFPGLSQHALLEQLLRKKLEPGAEGWINEYTSKANDVLTEGSLRQDEFADLWSWAKETSTSIVRPMYEEDGAFEDNFTIAEREAGIEMPPFATLCWLIHIGSPPTRTPLARHISP